MKIIFSPAKEMSLKNPINENWEITPHTQKVVTNLLNLSTSELKNIFNLSDNKFKQLKEYISNFNDGITYNAIDMYNGISFRQLDMINMDDTSKSYLESHLLILSALYGPISPYMHIKPYRIDMNTKLKIDDMSLKTYWKDYYINFINNGEIIINLASKEFSDLFDRNNYTWYDLDFYQEDSKGQLKQNSSFSKKSRGWMLNYMAYNNIENVEELRKINDEFIYRDDLSDEFRLVFVRK